MPISTETVLIRRNYIYSNRIKIFVVNHGLCLGHSNRVEPEPGTRNVFHGTENRVIFDGYPVNFI
jgi:hypothetical protein